MTPGYMVDGGGGPQPDVPMLAPLYTDSLNLSVKVLDFVKSGGTGKTQVALGVCLSIL